MLYVYSIKLHGLFDEWREKFRAAFDKSFVALNGYYLLAMRGWLTS